MNMVAPWRETRAIDEFLKANELGSCFPLALYLGATCQVDLMTIFSDVQMAAEPRFSETFEGLFLYERIL